jgi:hypothetical protein
VDGIPTGQSIHVLQVENTTPSVLFENAVFIPMQWRNQTGYTTLISFTIYILRKANWIGHILKRNSLLHDAIGQMTEVKGVGRKEEHSSLMI